MGDRECQKKFEQQASIKSSEYDRQNTNLTRQTNSIGRGQNFLPHEGPQHRATHDLLLQVISAIIGIGVFFLVMYGGKFLVSEEMYSGISFLVIDLLVSVMIAYVSFRVMKKVRKTTC